VADKWLQLAQRDSLALRLPTLAYHVMVDGTGVMLALAPGLLPGGKGGRGGILVSLRIFLERASGTAGPDMVVTKLLWEPGIK